MKYKISKEDALIIVDLQNDFCAGGALEVPGANQVIPIINTYIEKFKSAGGRIFATRDWHPRNHSSFKSMGGPWPPHCVQGTHGAKIHSDVKLPFEAEIVNKGVGREQEGYSGFEATGLAEELRARGIKRLFIGGLAIDYCVKHTVLDGLNNGFEVVYLDDASRGVEVSPGDVKKAIREMAEKGARIATLKDFA
ncbi:MAG: nicotinamidase [Candidatus Caldarchaeum sp.]